MRTKFVALLVLALLLVPGLTYAQGPTVEWTRWDALINVSSNNQLQIAETQEIRVVSVGIHHGTRTWTDAVNVQNVYILTGNNNTPQQLTQGNGTTPNTYRVSNSGGKTTLDYELPQRTPEGNSVVIQINYTATSPTTGVVDWLIVPPDHAFPVRSSTVRIRFPSGQAPDQSLVRSAQGNINASVSGNEVTIQSTAPIPANQPFAIQVPFGSGVGGAGNAGNSSGNTGNVGNAGNSGAVNPAPLQPNGSQDGSQNLLGGISGGTILLILCVVGVLLLFGGGTLLRSLLGSVLGGGLGGLLGGGGQSGGNPFGGSNDPFGGSNDPNSGSPFNPPAQGGSVNRGFRSSSNQDRSIGDVGNDKDRGGGASFS